MKKLFIFCCLLIATATIPLSYLSAKGSPILFFAPTRINLNDQNPIAEVRVTNTSDIARSYNLSLENLIMTPEGVTQRVDDFDYAAKRMLRLVPRQFDLQPGERRIVRIMTRIRPGTEDGQYHSHLEFLENIKKRAELNKDSEHGKPTATVNAQISYAAALPITITVGQIQTEVAISNVSFGYNDKNIPEVSLAMERQGNGQGNIILEVDHIAEDGTITTAATRQELYVYRELDKRNFSFILNLLKDNTEIQGGNINVKLFNRNISETEPVQEVTLPFS